MLKSVNRLKKDSDFQNIFRTGKRVAGGSLVIFYLPNNLEAPRFGVTVSKKISKKAVARNRIKRVLIAVVADKVKTGELRRSNDLIIKVNKFIDEDVSKLKEDLVKCLEKLS